MVGAQLDAADPGHVPQKAVAPAGEGERHRDLGVALDEVDDGALLVQQAVLVLAEPVEALFRVGVERGLAAEEVASAQPEAPPGRGAEVGNALGEQLRAVRPEEADQGRERDEPVIVVVDHLDDEVAVAHPRPAVGDLDLDLADRGVEQGAARRLGHGCPEGRADTSAALPPRVDLEDLAALEHREPRLAARERRHRAS